MNRFLIGLIVYICFATSILFADEPPNIVLIISDDQCWTDYGFMGHESIKTPNLDQLAKQGVVFKRGYVPTSLCRPSLMTLITGRYAFQHGVTGNDPSPKGVLVDAPEYQQQRAKLISFVDRYETLPQLLAKRGYRSFQSGKWWEGNFSRGGFTHGMTKGFPEAGGRHGDFGLKIGRDGLKPISDFIDESLEEKKPFFVWYAPFLPHTPHDPPQRLLEKYIAPDRPLPIAKYFAMCEWFDETCGELTEMLDKKDVRQNTLIVYVTDNGWIQNPDANGYAPRSKQTPYEGGIRTPIIFNWPEKLKPSERNELVSSIDLVPTILDATKCRTPRDLPGLSLWKHLKNEMPITRNEIFGEGYAHDIADLDNPEASLLYRWCIEDNWKIILTYDGEVNRHKATHPRTERKPQLFDLQKDSFETRNLAEQHPEVVQRLVKRIAEWYPLKERKTLTSD